MTSKTVHDVNEERKIEYRTKNNKYEDFPVGCGVRIICVCQDFNFFNGDETGKVIENTGKYLGIIVQFTEQIVYTDGSIRTSFNFDPDDLVRLNKPDRKKLLEI